MAYRIISRRAGAIGEFWTPVEGVNIDALIAGGFIEEAGEAPQKSAKKKSTTEAPDADQTEE